MRTGRRSSRPFNNASVSFVFNPPCMFIFLPHLAPRSSLVITGTRMTYD
jgi:hypothetical protein